MNEFDLIEKYFNWKNLNSNDLGIGDDCALVSIDAHQQIATSVDTLIEGVHFPKGTSASDIAHKALAVNLSDLAAMGATPKYFTLALTLPEFDESWLLDFSSTLRVLANQYQITLVGGDTTKGALSITLNVTGTISQGRALLRSAAQAGDHIFVSNSIGDAALAWRQIQQKLTPSDQLLQHFNTPNPQVELGCALVGVANACIDISDGLEQDLGHILKRSNVGARIDLSQIPLNKEVQSYIQKTQDWCVALAGGDDYELCFSVAPENLEKLKAIEKNLKIKLSEIGVITQNKGIERVDDFDKKCQSYQHF
ncbi:thiamine-phosphate kinase [Candidatus Thioglobus autotrophicus]|uniref:thiamine-phosphate kinase n=1 Tax=Candidatus Thioglobus autotrophicus TaxID=1705394 RepID=UPI00299E6DC4|nr:thiamine-phosphate kinase [Candidatus Thioglobus autotrophicus]WPE17444.1 thiamine-phosphate kinase [Candidatus Thioglobus autotrophicus]